MHAIWLEVAEKHIFSYENKQFRITFMLTSWACMNHPGENVFIPLPKISKLSENPFSRQDESFSSPISSEPLIRVTAS